jgi:hypothetical protein
LSHYRKGGSALIFAVCFRRQGAVELLQNHVEQDKGETQYVNVLEIPPVNSPVTAVKASIVADSKKEK